MNLRIIPRILPGPADRVADVCHSCKHFPTVAGGGVFKQNLLCYPQLYAICASATPDQTVTIHPDWNRSEAA
ncbi:MAG: hypothetical protein Q4G49_16865, partial [Paracoccus sp. (in: a-proteobacteria)]|nr:hypothetical protein [Paracoccus sp. (in: a-proteobacteria)]